MNETIFFELNNGEKVPVSLTFERLALLKKVNPDIYNQYNKMMAAKSEFDMVSLVIPIYVAYWCSNYSFSKECYTYDQFLELCPFNMNEIKRTLNRLTNPKKKPNLESNSNPEQD